LGRRIKKARARCFGSCLEGNLVITREIPSIQTTFQAIERIDLGDGSFRMSFGFDLGPLKDSIGAIGLINPPLIGRQGNGKLVPITGYRRILAAKALGAERIACRVVEDPDMSPLDSLLTALHENLCVRKFNDVEKGMILDRLSGHLPRTDIIDRYLPLLDLPRHEDTLHFHMRLERELDDDIKNALARGRLSRQVTKALLELDQAARLPLFEFFKKLNFNLNQQIQAIDYIVDISKIERKLIRDLLQEAPIRDMVGANDRINSPQRAKAVLRLLRKRRFPTLVLAEERFKKKLSHLRLPEGARIDPPPHFEAPHYRLEVLFKDGIQLRNTIERLLSQPEALEGLVSPWKEGS
jgi:hypothetical protein